MASSLRWRGEAALAGRTESSRAAGFRGPHAYPLISRWPQRTKSKGMRRKLFKVLWQLSCREKTETEPAMASLPCVQPPAERKPELRPHTGLAALEDLRHALASGPLHRMLPLLGKFFAQIHRACTRLQVLAQTRAFLERASMPTVFKTAAPALPALRIPRLPLLLYPYRQGTPVTF